MLLKNFILGSKYSLWKFRLFLWSFLKMEYILCCGLEL